MGPLRLNFRPLGRPTSPYGSVSLLNADTGPSETYSRCRARTITRWAIAVCKRCIASDTVSIHSAYCDFGAPTTSG
jgi:hypothetical protein